ncbi:hypothetical protein [Streptomyces sp. NPDC005799]|uniref:hypothetical protein n=1 Tax=Streptomyces sp. NPDC005799 TaxID=3154678 RepID=UPI0033E4BF7E
MANVYLHRLDRAWDARRHGVLVRYADDAVVMCTTREQAEAALGQLKVRRTMSKTTRASWLRRFGSSRCRCGRSCWCGSTVRPSATRSWTISRV